SCLGSRCCTSTKPMPVLSGRAERSWLTASRPPAEAPMPTMGKGSSPGRTSLATIGAAGGFDGASESWASAAFIVAHTLMCWAWPGRRLHQVVAELLYCLSRLLSVRPYLPFGVETAAPIRAGA